MKPFDQTLLEALLWMHESEALDFKSAQYPLVGATDEQKSELVKDMLAFANSWKTGDAHILLGLEENPGGRASVLGVTGHLDDADVQQLVNQKTNVPIAFEYVPLTLDGQRVGVLHVSLQQHRPIYLRKPFGKLKPNVVYVRRGSSTDEAEPEEIARMGSAATVGATHPRLLVELGDPESGETVGTELSLTSKVLEKRPSTKLTEAQEDALLGPAASILRIHRAMRLPTVSAVSPLSRPDPKEVVAYHKDMALLTRLGFRVTNVGQVLVNDARLITEIAKSDGLRVLDRAPRKPRSVLDVGTVIPLAAQLHAAERRTEVRELHDRWELVARVGKVQPNASVWSRPFWIGAPFNERLSVIIQVFGDNITERITIPVAIDIRAEQGWLESEEGEDDE